MKQSTLIGLGLGGLGIVGLIMVSKPASKLAVALKNTGGRTSFEAVDARSNTLNLATTGKRLGARPYTTDLEDEEIWNAVVGPVKSAPGDRGGTLLDQVLDQFNVASNPRYSKNPDGSTHCNSFVQDAVRALGYELPWGNANDLTFWLRNHAPQYGWRQVGSAEAVQAANEGRPSIAAMDNPGGIGHVAMVRRGPPVTIAQAGASNFNAGPIANGFGTAGAARATFHVNS